MPALIIFSVWIAAIVGWVLNIVHIFNIVDNPITAKFILMCVGVFIAPVGAVLGYVF